MQDREGRPRSTRGRICSSPPTTRSSRSSTWATSSGAEGKVFKTKTGELTILAEQVKLLTKSLRPLPEKWHGLKDVEERYRRRYVDLMVNQKVREVFLRRARIIESIRTFLVERGFVEVETPMMQVLPGRRGGKALQDPSQRPGPRPLPSGSPPSCI